MSWRWISIAALLAAFVVAYGAFTRRDPLEVSVGPAPEQPGYYLKDAVMTETRADGSIGMRLVANRVEQQKRDDSITLTTVRVDYYQVPDRQWVLSAQRGFVPANSRIVQLEGDVVLRAADRPDDTFLRVDALAVDTENNVAYNTTSPVILQSGSHRMKVKNFRADLKEEKIRAESVRGTYVPN